MKYAVKSFLIEIDKQIMIKGGKIIKVLDYEVETHNYKTYYNFKCLVEFEK